ncbi:MAG: response regulator [Proteobacteria bacterium]|nr:response regulator [Pseudomonadota bacterium]
MQIAVDELRVLVVEDSFEAMNLVKGMLADLGIHEVYTAKNGMEALDFLGSCDDLIDVVVCDWNMPRMTGIELLRQLRTVDPDMPFIMVTGAADQRSVIEAKGSGVTAYLVKPYSAKELTKKLALVARMLRARMPSVNE